MQTSFLRNLWSWTLASLTGLFLAAEATALTNSLASTPLMGWNSWYVFLGGIDEVKIRAMADAMATNGMKGAGYQYICIDDGWAVARDAKGMLVDRKSVV